MAVSKMEQFQSKRKVRVKSNIELSVCGANLLKSISSTSHKFIALPNKGCVELYKWPILDSKDTDDELCPVGIIELDDSKNAPLFLEWGVADIAPSFLAVAGKSYVNIYQCELQENSTSSMLIGHIPLNTRPTELLWHPHQCFLTVCDHDHAYHYDVSSPVKGPVLKKQVKFSVPKSLKCAMWAGSKQVNTSAAAADENINSGNLGAELVLAGGSELNLFLPTGSTDSSQNDCRRCFSGDVNQGSGGNFRVLEACLPSRSKSSKETKKCGAALISEGEGALFACFDQEPLVKGIGQGFGVNDKPRSLNCVFNDSLVHKFPKAEVKEGSSITSDEVEKKTETSMVDSTVKEGHGQVVDLRGSFSTKQSAVSSLLSGGLGLGGPSSSTSSFLMGNSGGKKPDEGCRVGLITMQNDRLCSAGTATLPYSISTPKLVAILPPCHEFLGIAAVAGANSVCLVSLGSSDNWKLKVVGSLNISKVWQPRGIVWHSKTSSGNIDISVLYAKRTNVKDPSNESSENNKTAATLPQPTFLTSSNLISMELCLHTYEITLTRINTSTGNNNKLKNNNVSQKGATIQTDVKSDAHQKAKDKVRESFLSMMSGDPSFLGDEEIEDVIIKNVNIKESSDEDVIKEEEETVHLKTLRMPSSGTTPVLSSMEEHCKEPVTSSSRPTVDNIHNTGASVDLSSALVTLSYNMGKMEERLCGKLDQVLFELKFNSERLTKLEIKTSEMKRN